MNFLLFASSFLAFAFALVGLWRPFEPLVQRLYPWAPLPAFLCGLYILFQYDDHSSVMVFGDLLLGVQIGLDGTGLAFLILISFVWLLAGLYSQKYFISEEQDRFFRFYFLATYSGAIGLTMALDAPTFYAGYAMMTISGYGLITHTRKPQALIAGRVYIIVALIGEMLTLAGLIIAASHSHSLGLYDMAESIRSSPVGDYSFWLIFIGFGTKVGLVPLHFWLPRSYYWAPLPAVAVLSGAMTKAGVLGWLRFLAAYESFTAANVVLAAGFVMAVYGFVMGIIQTRAKTTLAFSSLSQMGYLTMALSTLIELGAQVSRSLAAHLSFAYHHGITKVALFLGLGMLVQHIHNPKIHRLILVAMGVCSLALIGAPFTAGAYAKYLLKSSGSEMGMWSELGPLILLIGSIGTSVLMTRFMVLCMRKERDQIHAVSGFIPWSLSFLLVLFGVLLLLALIKSFNVGSSVEFKLNQTLSDFGSILIGSLITIGLTYPIWSKRSHLTPRPFDTILQGLYKSVWEDFPRGMDRLIAMFGRSVEQFHKRIVLDENFKKLSSQALQLRTSWFLGCSLLVLIGVVLWIFQAMGEIK